MSCQPQSTGQRLPSLAAKSSLTQHICHPQHLPSWLVANAHPILAPWHSSKKGCFWWVHLPIDVEQVTQTSLPVTLQGRADKCFEADLVQSVKWWDKAREHWGTAAAARPAPQETVRTGAAHFEQRHLSNCSWGILPNSSSLSFKRCSIQ